MPLAMLQAGALDHVHSAGAAAATGARAVPAASSARQAAAPSSSSSSSSASSSCAGSAARLPPTSLALCLHFLSLSSCVAAARTCRPWLDAARLRLAWSDGRQWLAIQGSREEMRELGTPSDDCGRTAARNFNPNGMHQTTTLAAAASSSNTGSSRNAASAASSSSSSSSSPSPGPLLRACQTPLLLNVRHLRYRFALPSIRTRIADLDQEDMFCTDVVAGRFPLCGLPGGSLPFLASLDLQDVTASSQLTVQSALASLGVQAHSHLRALKLATNPILSSAESCRTLQSILGELPCNLRNLQVLHLCQRNLSSDLSLDGLLSLAGTLHTLALDASFAKTAPRVQVIRALGLAALRHLKWPRWNHKQTKLLFGGIRRTLQQEQEQEEEDKAHAATNSSGLDPGGDISSLHMPDPDASFPAAVAVAEEEVVCGLDDDELDMPLSALGMPSSSSCSSSSSSSSDEPASCSFRFESWAIDLDVSTSNLALYFSSPPASSAGSSSLLPHLSTLSFLQPRHFSSLVGALGRTLGALPALTALRVQVAFFALGPDFFPTLARIKPLHKLRRLQLDQLNLVLVEADADAAAAAAEEQDEEACIWQAFPCLEDLSLLHMTLPVGSCERLAELMPRLKRLELDDVSAGHSGPSDDAMRQLVGQLSRLQFLTHLSLLHCVDLGVESLGPLAQCGALELLQFCPLRGGPSSSSSSASASASSHARHHQLQRAAEPWEHPSFRHFDAEDEPATIGATTTTARTASMQRQNSGGANAQQSRGPVSWLHSQLLALQQKQVLLHTPAPSSSRRPTHAAAPIAVPPRSHAARMRIEYWEENGSKRSIPALPATRH